ncbi:hypothetical protein MKW94_029762 [Papaver nudicaule]|uniref:F-box domain-containing protein n=1 Tax=Papaver nudicaule TaxID=74823 RepID=A0AA41SHL9_PAPNU|nr:hypothetical protein [Papaver nudicaule]
MDTSTFMSVSLRCLRLVSCYQVSDDALFYMSKKAVMLEELEICFCSFSEGIFKTVGKACPQLKSFRLNCQGFRRPLMEIDDEALAIAESMPQLRHLHLFGNKLTNVGLRAILDGCLHLESLDLRQCFNVNLEGDLLKNDSTDDYEFNADIIDGNYPFSEGWEFLHLWKMDCVMENQTPISTQEVRDWLELPVLSHIFLKLGAIDILFRAQSVCSTWRKVSREPSLFRCIDMTNRWDLLDGNMYDMEKMAREAVDRSCGQLVEFSMEHFGDDELVGYIADRSGNLKCLRLVASNEVGDDALIKIAKKAVMSEELEICFCSFSEDALTAVGNACPRLKSIRLNCHGYKRPHFEDDDEALAIAKNMPELRHLHLFGNKLTNMGLRAILDGCLHLESIDLRQCFNVNLEEYLLKSCRDRLIKLRPPNDSTDDFEFDAAFDDGSEFSDDSYVSDHDHDDEFPHNPELIVGYDNEFPYNPDLDFSLLEIWRLTLSSLSLTLLTLGFRGPDFF